MRRNIKKALAIFSASVMMVATLPISGIFSATAVAAETAPESGLSDSATLATDVTWSFSRFGQGISISKLKYSGSIPNNNLKITASAGKIVPANTDGLAYYYTPISADKNFKITGTVKVDSWTLSNGQEGFGLMAADDVGKDGSSSPFWNNSYMASVSKVDYKSENGSSITMKLGVLSQQKVGVTADNRQEFSADVTTAIGKYFSSSMKTLDTRCGAFGAGTYNMVGKYTNTEQSIIDSSVMSVTSFKFTIERNNTGYFVSYEDETGKITTNKYYDPQALCQINKDKVYVGFFASRNANVYVSDVSIYTSDPANDAPAQQKPITYVTPSYKILSSSTASVDAYPLRFLANADGQLTITDANNAVIVDNVTVKANEIVNKDVTLTKGTNQFQVSFTPDPSYIPGEDQLLSSYETKTFTHSVEYKTYGTTSQSIYVSQNGTADGTGSYEKPLDIYTAVKYAQPGQSIVLKGGVYNLTKAIEAPRGINGTQDNMIQLLADPASSERPVLDFSKTSAGLTIGGDYWYVQGIDITNTANFQKGMSVCGNNNVVDNVNIYNCGTTGLQISRLSSTDARDMWPSNNLILNCTSYNNADAGYEDADGFAAKLTIGEGNRFVGCISHHNADDGWDLFAKPESGAIGKVVVENCVAYANGYLVDGTNAGNGNGFKMGGSSITGKHELINCVSFDNKTKGIDSNSCPDIVVKNCTSYNNGASNIALYTNDATNTAFSATGAISFRYQTSNTPKDTLSLKGTQSQSAVYGTTNYYWDGSKSVNTANTAVSASWFKLLDTKTVPTRNADGSINMNDLLVLTDSAAADSGARLEGVASPVLTISEVIKDDETETPTEKPTEAPTVAPTEKPTEAPTVAPTEAPTVAPTVAPTEAPTVAPTEAPTVAPTEAPTVAPTEATTVAPTEAPTVAPTEAPTEAPTVAPTQATTVAPTEATIVDNNGSSAETGDSKMIYCWVVAAVMAAFIAIATVARMIIVEKKKK